MNGALDNFEVMQSQFGVRNGIRTAEVPSRGPLRLGGLGIVIGMAFLGILAFLRASLRASNGSNGRGETESGRG